MESFSQPDRFLWDRGAFTVMIPNGTRTAFHPRASMSELKRLLFRDVRLTRTGNLSKYQPLVPESKSYDFYLAQLVHYGLDFYFDVEDAKNTLERQMRLGILKVPPKLQKLEKELRKASIDDMKKIQDVTPVTENTRIGKDNNRQSTQSGSADYESDGLAEADDEDSEDDSEESSEEGSENGSEELGDISAHKTAQRPKAKASRQVSLTESSAESSSSEESDSSSDNNQSDQNHSSEDESDGSESQSLSASDHCESTKRGEVRLV